MLQVTDTDWGRVRRALLRQGEGDRVPLFEISIDKKIRSQFLGRPVKSARDEVEFWRTAGYDFVSVRAGVRSVVRGLHPVVKEWRLSRGQVVEDTGWVNEGTGIVSTREEWENFPFPKPEDLGGYNDYASLEDYLTELRKVLPADMKLLVQLGYVFMGTWQFLGFETFAYALADDPEFVKSVFDKLAESQYAVMEILLQHEIVGAIWMNDDMAFNSGAMVHPRVYRQYVFPWYKRMVERCHQANIPVGLHSDGDLHELLPDLIECGFDGMHPFEPPLMDIVEIKRKWGHRIAVAGNIDLKTTLHHGTPAEVEAEVRDKAKELKPGGGWLVGSSNSVPDFVPFENYLAMREASLKYGRYETVETAIAA